MAWLTRRAALLPLMLVSASQGRLPYLLLGRCTLQEPVSRFILPARLSEVSGLAAGPGGEVLAHSDESGIVVRIDPLTGEALGDIRLQGTPRADFEGVAVMPEGTVLMTSSGEILLLEAGKDPQAANGEERDVTVSYRRMDTGLGRICELEGLAWDGEAEALLLPCKSARDPRIDRHLVVMRWSPERRAEGTRITVPPDILGGLVPRARVRPTAVEWDSATGRILVLSSAPAAILELEADGRPLSVTPLDARRHPQAEGIALISDQLLIADEGRGGRGVITVYRCSE